MIYGGHEPVTEFRGKSARDGAARCETGHAAGDQLASPSPIVTAGVGSAGAPPAACGMG